MNVIKINQILTVNNFPKYRLSQVLDGIFKQFVSSWGEITNLPKDLIEILEKETPISSLEIAQDFEALPKDASKILFKAKDGNSVETVLMKHADKGESGGGRKTVCISSQAGCAMNCAFCATGQGGFFRNLTAEEMLDQVLHYCRILKKQGERVNNIVFMGMGEPFNNYDNVIAAIKLFNGAEYLNIGMRHISVSTCGIVPGIEKFAEENIQANLAISLHAPTDEIRNKLMPINVAFPIKKLFAAVDFYIEKTNRKVMFEYLLIDGINDSDACAMNLARLMKKKLYHVNLIKYHSTAAPLRAYSQSRQTRFFDILKKAGVSCTFRRSFGEDIKAACGQLGGK
ncbi:MAG TPA: 23S rRNA (adenine(2503)-C(2))-methyltransferase RlmN [Patescibacteria group bacterium]|nr:23S rRNA (adenine(2503)-C(2))-methyltransferase RlmN [Patescibacteria group bacterium]